jgi:hypothetical protein
MSSNTSAHIQTTQSAPHRTWISTHLPQTVAVVLTLLVTAIRVWFGRHITFCGTPDSCAYLSLGESLSHHHGFTQRFLYQYQFVSTHLPSHGIEYWRPGISLLLLLAQPFGGVTLHSSIVVTNLAAIALSLAAWKIAVDATANRRIACAAYLLCLVLPSVWSSSITPDSAIYYGAFAAWFLALFTVRFRSYTADAVALLCLAGVNLIRNDAILLFVPLVVVLWLRRRSAQPRGSSTPYSALMVACFFAAMLPMTLLQHAVLGKLSAGPTSHVLYLTGLSDLGRYGGPPLTLHTLLASGIGKLIKLRITTLPGIAYHFLFLQIGFSILFLATWGRWRRNTHPSTPLPEAIGGLTFATVLLAMYGLILPAIGSFSALKSLTGLLPLLAVVIVVCVYNASESPATATTLAAMTILLYIAFGISQDRRDQTELNKTGAEDRLIATWLAAHGADTLHSLIMTKDAAQFSETTGYDAIPVPSNGLLATQAAASDLDANYILLDQSDLTPTPDAVQSTLHATHMDQIPATTTYVLTMTSPPH